MNKIRDECKGLFTWYPVFGRARCFPESLRRRRTQVDELKRLIEEMSDGPDVQTWQQLAAEQAK